MLMRTCMCITLLESFFDKRTLKRLSYESTDSYIARARYFMNLIHFYYNLIDHSFAPEDPNYASLHLLLFESKQTHLIGRHTCFNLKLRRPFPLKRRTHISLVSNPCTSFSKYPFSASHKSHRRF